MVFENDKGDYIIHAEFNHAIDLKSNKVNGFEDFLVELLKYISIY